VFQDKTFGCRSWQLRAQLCLKFFAQGIQAMNPVATEDSALDTPPRSIWHALRDLAISTVVVTAVALMVGFISA
jgi:VanZ family protein